MGQAEIFFNGYQQAVAQQLSQQAVAQQAVAHQGSHQYKDLCQGTWKEMQGSFTE